MLGFRITPGYVTRTDDLYGQIMLSVEAADPELGHTMCFYGVGNHGGGPTKGNIEYILEHQHAFPDLELRFSTPLAFFDAVQAKHERLPLVTEELQRTFPGCYSVMHDIKQTQVRGEHLLEQGERVVEVLAADIPEAGELSARLVTAWKDLLFTEFHDILARTSIPSAWESVRASQGRARIIGEEVILEVTRRWARRSLPPVNQQQIVIINPDEAVWEGLIETEPFLDFDVWGRRWLSTPDGAPVSFQHVQPESMQMIPRILFPARVPAHGSAHILLRDDAPPDTTESETDLRISETVLENDHLRVELGRHGVEQIEVRGTRLLGETGIRLHLRNDHTDTWTFHTDRFAESVAEVLSLDGWVVEEQGPLRARIRAEGVLGTSRVRWTLSLCRDDPRLVIGFEVNFSEQLKLLQMPVDLVSSPAGHKNRLAGGWIARESGPTEWPVQGSSSVELAQHHLALVTSDVYSLSLNGSCWQWTLLRTPRMAWGGGRPWVDAGRDWFTDQGPHSWELILHAGWSRDEHALDTAVRQQAQPPIVFDRYEGLNRPPWGSNPDRALWTGAEQRARADGHMSHLRESDERGLTERLPDSPEV
ncbi:MAG: hypothetical protein M3P51_03185 [Chloroflexota bacterium]|nr:hypothetical protein [Chloroflexota bacterium]